MGNVFNCCTKINARIVILGMDENGVKQLYEKMTDSKVENAGVIEHHEREVKMEGIISRICFVPASDKLKNIWSTNALQSDGVIFVVDYDSFSDQFIVKEEINNLITNCIKDTATPMLILVRNGYNLQDKELENICSFNEQNVLVAGCDFETWDGYEEPKVWLFKMIKSNH